MAKIVLQNGLENSRQVNSEAEAEAKTPILAIMGHLGAFPAA